ncbi:MAG: HAD-IA family hydrolase, partial [Oscillospiraceae bacterium]|nr:HAD-IA family hydrolase [Oscillospiraceae bacterium]
GVRPTVGDNSADTGGAGGAGGAGACDMNTAAGNAMARAPVLETWIPGFDGDLYGQTLRVELLFFVRDERRFDSLDELKKQIAADGQTARRLLEGTGENGTACAASAPATASPSAASRFSPARANGGISATRAVFFDFDDTLQDRQTAFAGYVDFFLDKYFPFLPPALRAARRRNMIEQNRGGYVDYPRYFAALIAAWSWASAPSPAALYHEAALRFPDHTALFDDAISTLDALRARGLRLGVISNGPSLLQNRKLDVCGLRGKFDVCMVSGDEGVHKPAPEIFRRAALRLGAAPEECVFVGDHPVNDIQGAVGAGMRAVWMVGGEDAAVLGQAAPPDVPVIHKLSKLLDMV